VTTVDSPDALSVLATLDAADIVVVATSGHAAIEPTIRALEAGKIVALANKETIVCAGELVIRTLRSSSGELRPVDSEHSAIWQCLEAHRGQRGGVRKLILTASGGPFRGWTRAQLLDVQPADALRHPTWTMGSKITIDSATLMNKGLEILEAAWLFNMDIADIDVVIHPQSIVHSLVEFADGSMMAQLGPHDMRVPIQYALTYPERLASPAPAPSLIDVGRLDFEAPNISLFPLLELARNAGRRGSTFPTVLSASDELAVFAFLAGSCTFPAIADIVGDVVEAHVPAAGPLSLDVIHAADHWAREEVSERIQRAGIVR
jgi:1-deoxy-D-xylulose-5-phosphate reductoisomerase